MRPERFMGAQRFLRLHLQVGWLEKKVQSQKCVCGGGGGGWWWGGLFHYRSEDILAGLHNCKGL